MESTTVRENTGQQRRVVPYNGDQPYVFISYAHKDSAKVLPIIRRMMADGFRVWYDEGIDPGTEWDANIAEHIEDCGYFVALISENYIRSENCKDELNFARDLDKQRLLVYLQDVKLPSGMRMRLGRLQAIHQYAYSHEGDFYEKLYAAQGIEPCCGKACAEETTPAEESEPVYASRAEQQFRKAAEAGDAIAQNQLGNCYYMGNGVPQNYAEAVKWYRKAAAQGNPAAQNSLGSCYSFGNGVKKDYAEAVNWLRKAAEQGHLQAQKKLGAWMHNGILDGGRMVVAQDYEESLKWNRKAAEQGDMEAQYIVGSCYRHGIWGAPLDYAEAVNWLRKAAEQGHLQAQKNLGAWMSSGIFDGGRMVVAQDYEESLKWYRKAAEQGDGDAQHTIGTRYRYGNKGAPLDYAEAVNWLRKAAEQGIAAAQSELADCYREGKGVTQDLAEAVRWYRKAAHESSWAKRHLEELIAQGVVID